MLMIDIVIAIAPLARQKVPLGQSARPGVTV
jgi:hypothetical protein